MIQLLVELGIMITLLGAQDHLVTELCGKYRHMEDRFNDIKLMSRNVLLDLDWEHPVDLKGKR